MIFGNMKKMVELSMLLLLVSNTKAMTEYDIWKEEEESDMFKVSVLENSEKEVPVGCSIIGEDKVKVKEIWVGGTLVEIFCSSLVGGVIGTFFESCWKNGGGGVVVFVSILLGAIGGVLFIESFEGKREKRRRYIGLILAGGLAGGMAVKGFFGGGLVPIFVSWGVGLLGEILVEKFGSYKDLNK